MQNQQTNADDGRRLIATGTPNIRKLVTHGGATDGSLYFVGKHKGKRIVRALDTKVMAEARKKANVLLQALREERWEKLTDHKVRAGWTRLPEVFEKYLETATIKTAKRTVKMVEFLLRKAGKDPKGCSSQLGAHTVWEFQKTVMHAAGADYVKQAHAARSANSVLRQARALFAAQVVPAYQGLQLPDMTGFLKAPKLKAPAVQYVEPPAAVIQRIGSDYLELKTRDPGAYAWFLLGVFLGLRPAEVRAARWDWIEADGQGRSWLRLATRPHWRSKTSATRDVEIPPAVLAELQAVRGAIVDDIAGDPAWLIPGHHATERNARAWRRINAWLRSKGLDVANFPKGFYELRKYYGNTKAWQSGDLYRTARAMGNSPQVVERYYSSAQGRAPVEIPLPIAVGMKGGQA